MTPRQASVLLVFAFVTVLATAALPAAHAQDQAGTSHTRLLSLNPVETDASKCPGGAAPCWDLQTLVVNPGDNVTITIDLNGAAQPHDFHVVQGTTEVTKVPASPAIGGVYNVTFTMPASATSLDYFCNVHKGTMTGKITIQSALGATTGEQVPEMGVHFLSYWVGLIAFMLLFVVYGATFFLFKYNETPETTDHWERAGEGSPDFQRRFSPGMASVLAIILSAVVLAAVIYLARR